MHFYSLDNIYEENRNIYEYIAFGVQSTDGKHYRTCVFYILDVKNAAVTIIRVM